MAPASRAIAIDSRFNGPPGSANGGYACGVAARALTDGPADVRLRRPPPLGVAMDLVETDAGVELRHDGQVVASAIEWDGVIELPAPPSRSSLDGAVHDFDLDGYARGHPFDRCFTCGPARTEGDGLRIFPGAIKDSRMVAWRWTPSPSTAGDDGLVEPLVLWAALDCPSGLCWINAPDGMSSGPAVLGRLAVRIDRRPEVGEALVVGGWQTGADGRKLFAGSAVWAADDEVLASGAATWVVLDPQQAEAFGVRA